jgi:hypothetical protein
LPESSPDTTTSALRSYEDLIREDAVLKRVEEFSKFAFTVSYQNNGALTHAHVADAVLAATLESLTSALVASGIHFVQSVDAKAQHPAQVGGRLDGRKSIINITLDHSVFPSASLSSMTAS